MNKTIMWVALAIVVGGLGFFGGFKYGQNKAQAAAKQQTVTRGQGGAFAGRRNGGQAGMGFTAGQIIGKDDKSLTVKMMDGSSRIVFYSASTSIGKTATGTVDDLVAGEQVIVNGPTNSDGSVTAQNIQIRPQPQTSPSGRN